MKLREQRRAECLRKAMNKALDRVILPLKKSRPEAFKEWMALQADYNRWMAEACAAAEEANWVDLTTGERSMGTGYGFTESQCLQRHHAWRGFHAEAWARGERNPLASLAPVLEGPRPRPAAPGMPTATGSARAPPVPPPRPSSRRAPRASCPGMTGSPMWKGWSACWPVPSCSPRGSAPCCPPPTDCVQRFADSLFAQMDPPQPRAPPKVVRNPSQAVKLPPPCRPPPRSPWRRLTSSATAPSTSRRSWTWSAPGRSSPRTPAASS
ncbi:hypothetical protein ACN28S_55290 [Cystobacter fuscus]